MGKDTVCRVEERKHPNQSAIEFINDVFNPVERVEKQIAEQGRELSEIRSIVTELLKGQKNLC
jgi:archaellum component FlaC